MKESTHLRISVLQETSIERDSEKSTVSYVCSRKIRNDRIRRNGIIKLMERILKQKYVHIL